MNYLELSLITLLSIINLNVVRTLEMDSTKLWAARKDKKQI